MPKLTGIFEQLKNIDKVPPEEIGQWLKAKEQPHIIENFIGNRLIYPQTVAVTSLDMDLDFALLREYIRQNKYKFYRYNLPQGANPKQAAFAKKIIVLEDFLRRFPPLIRLIEAYLDVLELTGIVTVLLSKDVISSTVGTVVSLKDEITKHNFVINIDDKATALQNGVINIVKNTHRSVKIQIGNDSPFVVSGGELGVVVDLR